MIISYSKNFIFIHLEKTGGTSVEEAISPYLKWNDWICGGTTFGMDIWRLYFNRYGSDFVQNGLWKHASIDLIKNNIGLEKYNSMYKFTTVRDPIELMKSAYFFHKKFADINIKNIDIKKINNVVYDQSFKEEFKVIDNTIFSDDICQSLYFETLIEESGIDEWIKKIINSNDQISQSQISRIGNDVEFYDISNINDYWTSILNKIKINDDVKLEKLNVNINKPITCMLKSDTIDLIKTRFKEDYDTILPITKAKWQ